jgi:3-dehydro-4-phosphotetronate decarboxylase
MQTEAAAREEICRVGRSLFERGYVHSTAGNISLRLSVGFLITPTDACLGFLDPARLSKLDSSAEHVSGDKPSKTAALHEAIYRAVPTAACIIHTHSTHCVALSLEGTKPELLEPITPYFVMKVGHVPLVPYTVPGDASAIKAVTERIGSYAAQGISLRAVMLARLGPVVWQQSPAAAMALLEELEETAKLQCLAPGTQPLGEVEIAALKARFNVQW